MHKAKSLFLFLRRVLSSRGWNEFYKCSGTFKQTNPCVTVTRGKNTPASHHRRRNERAIVRKCDYTYSYIHMYVRRCILFMNSNSLHFCKMFPIACRPTRGRYFSKKSIILCMPKWARYYTLWCICI